MKKSLCIEAYFSLNKQDPHEPTGIEFRLLSDEYTDPKRDLAKILETHFRVPDDGMDTGLYKRLEITIKEI